MSEESPQSKQNIIEKLIDLNNSPILKMLGLRESKKPISLGIVIESLTRLKIETNKNDKYSNSEYFNDLYSLLNANEELRGGIDMSVLRVQFDLIKNEPGFEQASPASRFYKINKILSQYNLSNDTQRNIYAYMDTQGVKANNL